jgi:hypothetical protein
VFDVFRGKGRCAQRPYVWFAVRRKNPVNPSIFVLEIQILIILVLFPGIYYITKVSRNVLHNQGGFVMYAILQAIERLGRGEDFYVALGDFLDEFYRQDRCTRQAMIDEGPQGRENVSREHAALFAASAHKLANDYGLAVPKWVMDKKYKLAGKPYFDCNATGNLRLLFMYKSPIEFKHRNLFVDENFLMRV